MYTKNFKTVLKDTKENLNKWKDIPYSWIRFNIVKIATLLNLQIGRKSTKF